MSEKKVSHDVPLLHPSSEEIKLAGQKRSIAEEIVTQDGTKSDCGDDGKSETFVADHHPIIEKLVNTIENAQGIPTTSVKVEEVEVVEKDVTPPQSKKKRKTRRFITIEEFNRFAQHQPFKWLDLPQDCIYKLEQINAVDDDEQVSGNFTNADGVTISVLIPQIVHDKLVALTEPNVNIYIKSKWRGDQVDIATITKDVCKNCSKELSSHNYLRRHLSSCKVQVERR